jgi:multisubunit Na+/H+ antiporter MnhG subunit
VFFLDVTAMLLIAILAGTLSLGEERTSGTHSWQLTLPVSARRQWFIKLCMALFAGFVGAGLAPLLIARRLMAPLSDVHVGRDLLVGAVLLTFAAFWCACAVKGTVPAVLWTLPVLIAVCCAVELGKWAGPALTNLFLSRFDPFANVKFAHAVSRFTSTSFFRLVLAASIYTTNSFQAKLALTALILVPTLLYAAIQSYRLFRAQVQDRVFSVVRRLVPLAVLAFLCSFFSLAFYTVVIQAAEASRAAQHPKETALIETVEAIQNILSGGAKPEAAHPLELTVEDLAKASTLSKSTRRLLGDSHITLFLDAPPHHSQFGCAEYHGDPQPHGISDLGYSWYSAIIPLRDGSHFFVTFDPVTHYLISAGICAGQPPRFPIGLVRLPR